MGPMARATPVVCNLEVTRHSHCDVYSNRLTRGQHQTVGGVWCMRLPSNDDDDDGVQLLGVLEHSLSKLARYDQTSLFSSILSLTVSTVHELL